MFINEQETKANHFRLAIASILVSTSEVDFVYLRDTTRATAVNLSVQIEKLKEAGYITVEKSFKGKMPRTTCRMIPEGVTAVEIYVETLKSYLPH